MTPVAEIVEMTKKARKPRAKKEKPAFHGSVLLTFEDDLFIDGKSKKARVQVHVVRQTKGDFFLSWVHSTEVTDYWSGRKISEKHYNEAGLEAEAFKRMASMNFY